MDVFLNAANAGLALIVAAALLISPVLHRVLHRFHWDESSGRPER